MPSFTQLLPAPDCPNIKLFGVRNIRTQCPEYLGPMSGISGCNVRNTRMPCSEYPGAMSGVSGCNVWNIRRQCAECLCAMSCEGVRADHIPDKVNQFGTVGVMSIRPIIARTGLPKDEVVWPEGLAKKGPARTMSMVPGSRSIKMTRGT